MLHSARPQGPCYCCSRSSAAAVAAVETKWPPIGSVAGGAAIDSRSGSGWARVQGEETGAAAAAAVVVAAAVLELGGRRKGAGLQDWLAAGAVVVVVAAAAVVVERRATGF